MDKKKNKTIWITIGVFVAVILVVVVVLFAFKKKSDKTTSIPPEYTTQDEFVQENTTGFKTQELTKPELDESINWPAAEMEDIDAFVTGSFYIDCKIDTADEESQNVKLAKNGNNFQMGVSVEGLNLSVMMRNSNFYIINTSKKQYIAIDKTMMDALGLDVNEITEEFKTFDFSVFNFTDVKREITEFDDKKCAKYTFTVDEGGMMIFYVVDNHLKRIEMADSDGQIAFAIAVNEFNKTIPNTMLTLNGLMPTTMVGFAAGLGLDTSDLDLE